MDFIKDNYNRLISNIEKIKAKNNINYDIKIVAVTKYYPVEYINEIIKLGILDIGENRVQEAMTKFNSLNLQNIKITKHLLGHLQTNKINNALATFDVIQSIDSIKLIDILNKKLLNLNRKLDIFLEIKTSDEESKTGFNINEIDKALEALNNSKFLILKGLMTIAPLTDNKKLIRRSFKILKDKFDYIKSKYNFNELKYLSMGMSEDYDIAIEEGSNMIRIGSALLKK